MPIDHLADQQTPGIFQRRVTDELDLLKLHIRQPDRLPFLLESVTGADAVNRYSLLLAVNETEAISLQVDELAAYKKSASIFFDQLEAEFQVHRTNGDQAPPDSLPFIGGWFLLFGYELAAGIEPRLNLPVCDLNQPVAYAKRCDAAVIVDHHQSATYLVAESEERLDFLETAISTDSHHYPDNKAVIDWQVSAEDGSIFCRNVERIKAYIEAGDVFQVNLSRSWQASDLQEYDQCNDTTAINLYDSLRSVNPAPFAGLAKLPGGYLLSASPERLALIDKQQIDTRPIAGTRRRGDNAVEDEALLDELIRHPKERAEHVMLIDLERNDLGRVCVPGTIEVNEFMIQESYASVHHIVSNVRGRLRPEVSPIEAVRAVFPGGTITGCPKVRCMEIIAELEQQGRGIYTGAMGYLSRDGRMDTNILIRSGWWQDNTFHWRCGSGIVADSDPQAELHETEAKANGLITALRHNAG